MQKYHPLGQKRALEEGQTHSCKMTTTWTKQTIWGNLVTDGPMEIWQSPESIRFRKILHERKLPDTCKGCPQGELGVT